MEGNSIYRPLPGPDFLRILILHPALEHDAPLHCDMEVSSLSTVAEYTALSYSWGMNQDGDDTRNRHMILQGQFHLIPQNLFEGLRRLRSAKKPLRIWVDAVCINQNDTPERSAQVLRMAEIFAHASSVAVWLGENGTHDEVASAILNCFGDSEHDHVKRTHTWPIYGDERNSLDFCSFRKTAASRKMKTSRKLTFDAVTTTAVSLETRSIVEPAEHSEADLETVITALDALFNRRYFQRRWVLQELFHSPPGQTTVYFGPYNLSLDKFASVCFASIKDSRGLRRFIVGSQREGHLDWKAVQYGLRKVERVLRLAIDKEKATFLEALERSSHLLCKDPRDILYSLASLDPDFGVVPNYNLNVAEVYTTFAGLLVQKGMWQSVLDNLRNHMPPADQRFTGWPSWVPDFKQGFARSSDVQVLNVYDSEVDEFEVDQPSEAATIDGRLLSCTFFAIGVLHFGARWPGSTAEFNNRPSRFESMRRRMQTALCLPELSDVCELTGAKPYDDLLMGDLVCSSRRIYTTEEAVIVILSPLDLNAAMFRIVQVRRGIDLSSLNGQSISELSHHAELPGSARFRAIIT